jgi:hypothetical protein
MKIDRILFKYDIGYLFLKEKVALIYNTFGQTTHKFCHYNKMEYFLLSLIHFFSCLKHFR